MNAQITATGNAGVHIAAGTGQIFIDAFWDPVPRVLGKLSGRGAEPLATPAMGADLILVTHAHWDHFSADRVVEAVGRTGAAVIGPLDVIRTLRGTLPDGLLTVLEPAEPRGAGPAATARVELPEATVTAYRTRHGRGHNSYLVEMGGFRLFHDGDNEDARLVDPASLGPVDALLLCPWQGSGWAEFVERLAPRQWMLVHLSPDEIAAHQAGQFLPDLCESAEEAARLQAAGLLTPPRTIGPAPGEVWTSDGPAA